MQLGFAHGPFDPQEQAIVVLSRIINAILVNDEGIGQATNLDEAIPIAARTGQARCFQAEDGAGTAATQGQRSLNCCAGKDFEHEVFVPPATAAFHNDTVAARVLLQQ